MVSFISSSSYLAGRSHPIMRESLCRSFNEIWIDNLSGDKYKTGKVVPRGQPGEGTADQSIFSTDQDPRGIQPGTAITTLLKRRAAGDEIARAHYRDLWGRSGDKRASLLASLSMSGWTPERVTEAADIPAGPVPDVFHAVARNDEYLNTFDQRAAEFRFSGGQTLAPC